MTAGRFHVFAVVVFFTVGGVGCATFSADLATQLRQAERDYRLARYKQADRGASAVIEAQPAHPDTAEAHYVRALVRLRGDHRDAAQADLDRAVELGRRREVIGAAHVQIGHIEFDDGRFDRAAAAYARAIPLLGRESTSGDVLYRLAICRQRLGDFARSRRDFDRVVRAFPGCRSAAAARQKLTWAEDCFSIQCGAYSQKYRAKAAAQSLSERGVRAVVSALPRRVGAPFIVHVGRFRDFDEARAALGGVRRVQPDAFLIP